jgi:hypothetical protein
MKVFVVTSGCYSDYTIERLFSNRSAAEEYKKWHGISNEIEELYVYDEPFTKEDGERAMLIRIQGTVCPEAVGNIRVETRHTMIHDYTKTHGAGITRMNYGSDRSFAIYTYRSVPINIWDEEKWKVKMTKHLFDLVAVAKSMFAEGASVSMVEKALSEQDMED